MSLDLWHYHLKEWLQPEGLLSSGVLLPVVWCWIFLWKGAGFCSQGDTPVTYTVTVTVVAIFLWAGRLHRSAGCTCKLHLLTAMQRREQLLLKCLFLFPSKRGALSIIYYFHLVAVQNEMHLLFFLISGFSNFRLNIMTNRLQKHSQLCELNTPRNIRAQL